MEVSAKVHQGVLDSPLPGNRHGPVHTIPLPDTSQIHTHVLFVEEDHVGPAGLADFKGLIEVPSGVPVNVG